MNTNNTTLTRDDFDFKHCSMLPNSDNALKYSASPLCILDIRVDKTGKSFEFVVSHKGGFATCDVDSLGTGYRLWLLAKFKDNLRRLSIVEEMRNWVYDRLLLLKEYCDVKGLEYEALYVKCALPPRVSAKFGPLCAYSCNNNERHKRTKSIDTGSSETKKKSGCVSADENQKTKKNRLLLSKVQKNRSVLNGLKILIQKYAGQGNIDRETLLSELDCLRPHIYDN